eukprot:scaffold7415_cov170-Amphora_coffeaeformis.AAC.10
MQHRNWPRRSTPAATALFITLLVLSGMVKPVYSFTMNRLNAFLRRGRRIERIFGSNLDDLIGDLLDNPSLLNSTVATTTRFNKNNTRNRSSDGWKTVDWKAIGERPINTTASPVDVTMILDRVIHIKRDDLRRLSGSQISGNKARKMFSLNYLDPFPRCIVSYGGPQSNAMLALAAVVHFQNDKYGFVEGDRNRRRFVYFTKTLPRFLKKQPSGNLFRATSLGMELIELSNTEYANLFGGDAGGSLAPPPLLNAPDLVESVWIPQGGACEAAMAGTEQLAEEILCYWSQVGRGRPLSVVLPGGTCSTAALLHWAIQKAQTSNDQPIDIQVVVIPCIGDASYARRQMTSLYNQLGITSSDLPLILPPSPGDDLTYDYFSFGEPDPAILETFTRMRDENDVVLDLLYGAPSWTILLRHLRPGSSKHSPMSGREIMYVHSGGLEGINSQLLRYKYKGFIDADDIQLPGKNKNDGQT